MEFCCPCDKIKVKTCFPYTKFESSRFCVNFRLDFSISVGDFDISHEFHVGNEFRLQFQYLACGFRTYSGFPRFWYLNRLVDVVCAKINTVCTFFMLYCHKEPKMWLLFGPLCTIYSQHLKMLSLFCVKANIKNFTNGINEIKSVTLVFKVKMTTWITFGSPRKAFYYKESMKEQHTCISAYMPYINNTLTFV